MKKIINKKLVKIFFNKLPLIFILFFALLLRLWWLNQFPVGITYDEVEYVLDAKAIFYTGRDISGSWSPLSLTTKSTGVLTAELPALIVSPFIGPLRLSLFAARFPYAISSVLLVLFVYLISKELLKSTNIALIAVLLLSINPWSFHFGRTAFEAPVAVLFYLIAVYTLLKTHSWKILLSFPFLFLGFFSYLGTKLIFLPLVFVVCFFHYFYDEQKNSKKPYVVLILLSVLLVFCYVLSLKHQPAGIRMNDLLFGTDKIAQDVNMERRLSLPNSLIVFFSNKATVLLKTFISNYLGAFSIKLLFLFGEERGAFSIWTHGLFYYIDLIFILIGFYYLFRTNKKIWLFLSSLTAIAPLPSALGIDYRSYVLRSALLYPLLTIFATAGIACLVVTSRRHKRLIGSMIITIYLFSLANYLYLYFFRYPVYGSEGFFFSDRVLSKYISLYSKTPEKKVVVVTPDAGGVFKQYLFHLRLYSRERIRELANNLRKEQFKLGNVNFTDVCPKKEVIQDKDIVLIYRHGSKCEEEIEGWIEKDTSLEPPLRLSISNLADAGEIYRIYGDEFCFSYDLRFYPQVTSKDDFQVENQDVRYFCEKWIMDLSQIEQGNTSKQ